MLCWWIVLLGSAGDRDKKEGDGKLKEAVKQGLCLFPHAEM